MKKLKPNQIGPWCSYCPPKTSRAVYVQLGWRSHACAKKECIDKLLDKELIDQEEHYNEADYQTWMKL